MLTELFTYIIQKYLVYIRNVTYLSLNDKEESNSEEFAIDFFKNYLRIIIHSMLINFNINVQMIFDSLEYLVFIVQIYLFLELIRFDICNVVLDLSLVY